MSSGWTCSYQVGDKCDLLQKTCDPGDKGCTLYGKAVFSNPENPSNEAVRRREERKKKQDEIDASKFF